MARRRGWSIAVAVLLVVAAAGWYAYHRSGPHDAASAGARVDADVRALISGLGLRQVSPDGVDHVGVAGEDCVVRHHGDERPLTEGPHRQHRISYAALPPAGRRVTDLRGDAERVLRRLGYRIVTDQVDFDQAPPDGHVIAEWGWRSRLEIMLWPRPDRGVVGITGTARCLPVR